MNQELWEAIVAELQELRELTIEQYEQQCGLDPERDRARIDELYRGQRYLAPDYLAPLLEAAVAAIVRVRGLIVGRTPWIRSSTSRNRHTTDGSTLSLGQCVWYTGTSAATSFG